jgi:hypothetical protein
VAEHLHAMSSATESKFFDLPFVFSTSAALVYLLSLVFFALLQNLPGYLHRLCQQMMIP